MLDASSKIDDTLSEKFCDDFDLSRLKDFDIMKNRNILFFLLLICLLSISQVSAQDASDSYHNATGLSYSVMAVLDDNSIESDVGDLESDSISVSDLSSDYESNLKSYDSKPTVVRQCLGALHEVILYRPEMVDVISEAVGRIDVNKYKDSMSPLIRKDIEALIAGSCILILKYALKKASIFDFFKRPRVIC